MTGAPRFPDRPQPDQATAEYVERKRALEEAIGDHDTHLSLGALRNRLAWQREEEEAWR